MAPSATDMVEVKSEKQFNSPIPQEPVYDIASLGEGLELKNRKNIDLSFDEAVRLINLSTFAGDRPLDDNWVIHLTRQMKAGTFLWEQVNIVICKFAGVDYRMNGHHTCYARLNMPKGGYAAPIQLLRYEAVSEHDMRRLYANIDRAKPRSARNVVHSYLDGTSKFQHVNRRTLGELAEGIAFWKWADTDQRKLHTPDDRAFMMETDHYQLTSKIASFLNAFKTKEVKHLRRRPVVAAMFATFDKAPDIAASFWRSIATGAELSQTDARLALYRKLLTSTMVLGNKAPRPETVTTSPEEMFRWCVLAWNAHRQNRSLKNLKAVLDGPRPTVR